MPDSISTNEQIQADGTHIHDKFTFEEPGHKLKEHEQTTFHPPETSLASPKSKVTAHFDPNTGIQKDSVIVVGNRMTIYTWDANTDPMWSGDRFKRLRTIEYFARDRRTGAWKARRLITVDRWTPSGRPDHATEQEAIPATGPAAGGTTWGPDQPVDNPSKLDPSKGMIL
jgi:hypothetical protein